MPYRIPNHKNHQPNPPSAERKAAKAFYKRKDWRTTRAAFIATHPLCAECDRNGLIVAAVDVHHIIDRVVDPSKTFDWDNLESLCKSCHATITAERQKKNEIN